MRGGSLFLATTGIGPDGATASGPLPLAVPLSDDIPYEPLVTNRYAAQV